MTTVVPSVDCGAGHTFCFGCRMDQSHNPTICLIASKWIASKDDSGSLQWIKVEQNLSNKCRFGAHLGYRLILELVPSVIITLRRAVVASKGDLFVPY